LRSFVGVLGGPLASAVLVLLALRWTPPHEVVGAWDQGWQPRLYPGIAFLATCLLVLGCCIVPFKARIGNSVVRTDGWQLATIPFLSRSAIDAIYAQYVASRGDEYLLVGRKDQVGVRHERGLTLSPEQVINAMGDGDFLLSAGTYRAARARLSQALVGNDLSFGQRGCIADGLARAILGEWLADGAPPAIIPDSDPLREAQHWCEEALRHEAHVPPQQRRHFRLTLAMVQIERGQAKGGMVLLKEILPDIEEPAIRAHVLSYLALAAARQLDWESGRKYLEQARQLNAQGVTLERASREVGDDWVSVPAPNGKEDLKGP
jgi:hypothetical protein